MSEDPRLVQLRKDASDATRERDHWKQHAADLERKLKKQVISKYCVECVHWEFYGGWGGSDVTAGDDWSSRCTRGYWRAEGTSVSSEQWARHLRTAATCSDFKERRE